MEKKYWFVPKDYGWGLMPISWEGWLVTFLWIAVLAAYGEYGYGIFTAYDGLNVADYVRFLFDVTVAMFLFVYSSKGRTKGEVKWYWGNRPK